MSVLITGASGFIGSALCAEMAKRQLSFFPVYRQATARTEARIVPDIHPATDWSAALAGVEVVIHLAARVHVMQDTEQDPLAAYRAANCAATLNLARQAAAQGVRRFVFLSSIKVNGEETAPGQPFHHDSQPAPQDPYGVSKWEAEQGLWQVAAETGMEVVVIRPPLVYGPGVKANFAQLMRWVKKGIPLPLASIHNQRSMVFLGNLLDLILVCSRHAAAAGQTFLVSDGQDVSTPGLIRAIAAAYGKTARLLPCPPGVLQVLAGLAGRGAAVQRLASCLQVDISHTCASLDWVPPYRMEQGLRLSLD